MSDPRPTGARRGERSTAVAFGVSIAAALGLVVVFWRGGQPQVEGVLLALATGGIGVGLIVWAKHFMPHDEITEERHDLASSEEEIEEFREELERGEHILERRGLLIKMALGAAAALGAALLFPIRSLGPRPGRGLKTTAFRDGVRLVTQDNAPVRPSDVAKGGLLTVFPEDHVDDADAPTLLIRPGRRVTARPGRGSWTPDGLVAYSKLCTHVGCPVGLYQDDVHLLLCPCHQSTFDVLDGARPVFGPATRSLPQLPLVIDGDGYLTAGGDFSDPPGPGFWGPRSLMAATARNRLVTRRVARWIDDRLGSAKLARTALGKVFPDHWSFMIGEVALYAFVVLVLTGTYLTFFFDASSRVVTYHGSYAPLRGVRMTDAYRSALDISFDTRAGLVMRQVHHWAALLFIAAIVVHMMRIFFTGAFRRPRELNWMIGVTLLILAIFNGFAGYSLLDDQLSGTGLRIAYSIALSIPIAGTWLASLLFGGEFPGPDIISRLFVIHILLIPAVIVGLLAAHLGILVRQKHTQFRGPGRTEENVVGERVWPSFAFKSVGLMFLTTAVLCAMGGLAQINPIWLYGPFRPAEVSSASQPDWYMGWLDGALRLYPAWEIRAFGFEVPAPFFPAVALAGATFTALYLWPFIEARLTRDRAVHHLLDRPRDVPWRTALGVAAFVFYAVMTLAASSDVTATTFGLSVNAVIWAFRGLAILAPPVAGLVTYRLCVELAARDPVP